MNSVIWKFPFEVLDEFSIDLPIGSQFLKVDVQDKQPCMWFQVFPEDVSVEENAIPAYEHRKFRVIGTGHEFNPSVLQYLGSFMLLEGKFVGHLYEVVE